MTSVDRSPRMSRRRLLGAGLAGASAVALSGLDVGRAGATGIQLRPNGLPRFPEESGIEHVVVVMMENRSYDHMLGWLDKPADVHERVTYLDRDGNPQQPWHLDTFTGDGFADPSHSFSGGRTQFNGGRCDGWLQTGSGDPYPLGYYLAEDLSFYGNAAPYWTVCDRFFASFMGPTYPNRFYLHAAKTDRSNNALVVSTLPTIWDSLAAAGLTGRYYYSDLPFLGLWGTKYLPLARAVADFYADCAAGALPNVSVVEPRFATGAAGAQNDDHPHADVRRGQHFLNQVYAAVSQSPNWEHTVLVITYDEWGGFFDHVPPDVVPDANPAWGLRGFRIPAIVISPRARRGSIPHGKYDPTSILRMIEWRWGLPPLSPRDATSRNLAEVLDFANPPDLTAPQWDVPDIDETAALSARADLDAPGVADGDQAHADEWQRLGDLAASHGFAV